MSIYWREKLHVKQRRLSGFFLVFFRHLIHAIHHLDSTSLLMEPFQTTLTDQLLMYFINHPPPECRNTWLRDRKQCSSFNSVARTNIRRCTLQLFLQKHLQKKHKDLITIVQSKHRSDSSDGSSYKSTSSTAFLQIILLFITKDETLRLR